MILEKRSALYKVSHNSGLNVFAVDNPTGERKQIVFISHISV